MVDYIVCMGLSFVAGVGFALAGMGEFVQGFGGRFIGIGVFFAYYLLFEGVLGRTPGKFLTGTKVVDLSGKPPSFGQVLGRTASRFVPFEPFSFLGAGSGWHDRWSKTTVVKLH